MVVIEYRIVLPYTLNEYERGMRYMSARQAVETNANSANGEKVTLVERSDFKGCPADVVQLGRLARRQEFCEKGGTYYNKTLYLGNRFPSWCRRLVPERALYVTEEYWLAFPYSFCKYTSWAAKADYTIESIHLENDTGDSENLFASPSTSPPQPPHHCSAVQHSAGGPVTAGGVGTVERIDIAAGSAAAAGVPQGDPTAFRSKAAQRGPLVQRWWTSPAHGDIPRMCAYKRASLRIHYVPFSATLEKLVLDSTVRHLAILAYRNQFCWMDEWFMMTKQQVADFEKKVL
jgi:hypothetical protein